MNKPILITLEGTLPPERAWQYTHLPFDVPDNIGQIDVRYTYDSAIDSDPALTGGNTLDIGIFDARGIGSHSPGYRGWSGSARALFFIALDAATPGYLPGAILPGRWHIVLGPYKVAPGGCRYRVSITLTPTEQTSVEFPALLRLSDSPARRVHDDGWYRGELHCHTVHSDGDSAPDEMVRLAESLGLDFLAITDHNNRTQGIDLARRVINADTDLMLIPGYEVTTYYGHWNIWGDDGWIDFRVQSAGDLAAFIDEANRRGFLVSCNHPRPQGPDWAFRQVSGFQCVEVWNGPWRLNNRACLAFWEERLRRGERLTAVGGSDYHFSRREHDARLSQPTTFIYCPEAPSPAGLLRALRAGHALVSESSAGPRLDLRSGAAMMGDLLKRPADGRLTVSVEALDAAGGRVQVIGAGGVLAEIDPISDSLRETLTVSAADTPYVRAQIVDPATGDVRALTNPIYLE